MNFIDEFLNSARRDNLANVLSEQAVSVSALDRKTLNVSRLDHITHQAGRLLTGKQGIEITANQVMVRRLNYFLVYSNAEAQMTPDISIPAGGISFQNVLIITLIGKHYNNTGGALNATPKIYLGLVGSETQVSSATAVSLDSSTSERGWKYVISISASPLGGTYVQVDEEFTFDASGDTAGFVRSTTTQVGTITSLDEIDNLYVTFTLASASAAMKLWTNILKVELLEGTVDEATEYRFYSTSFEDTLIQSSTPSTNYGTSTTLNIGEHNALSSNNRTLMRCMNLTDIPAGAKLQSGKIRLYISADLASNPITIDLLPMLKNWTEAGATWQKYDGTNSFGVEGGQVNVDYSSEVWASASLSPTEPAGKVVEFVLTAAGVAGFQAVIDGGTNYGLMSKGQTETDNLYQFASSENTTVYAVPSVELIYQM